MSTQPEGTVSNTPNTPSGPLALPAPSQDDETTKLDVHTMQRMKFDALGPMVVNSDGTLSRIANWPNMTPMERERTMRVLGARNQ
ncbi:hypothetical protein GLOTRDRAFT_40931 [Gloeophyllum trabeum ATCC 11539]|uniref:Uncharacterized protein n=1 Tax=Gloeophyllum trabeum (strain ATCC 11539 / FP-39264 / Madison 617) TaxID=670483 RepID=S7Q6F7_GLOTA|nr:uncharacterized protein GLOTRDRAFT_40931 [Gloeophyllum trabeum ATCC 11539]EPQ55651.1 hypothetical protein GLOTRDRAFT_40931 [Gloeophyllum trabeum ATCC 11539]